MNSHFLPPRLPVPAFQLNRTLCLALTALCPSLTHAQTIGENSLAPRFSLPAQTLAIRVAIADLDQNAKKELVYINYGTHTLSVYDNHSSPGDLTPNSFSARPDLPTPPNPYALAVGDVDGDQWPDIVVGSRVGDTSPDAPSVVSVFRNRGLAQPGAFEERLDLPVGRTVTGVAIGDLDGDGKMDIAAANLDSGTVSLFRGIGTPGTLSFAGRTDMTDTVFPLAVVIGDLDGDGHQDLAVSNFDANTVSVYRNTGQGTPLSPDTFEPRIDLQAGARTHSIAMNDLDGDGRLDLLAANAFAHNISIYHTLSETGSIAFAPQLILPGGTIPHTAQPADLNRDGRPDLLVAAAGSQRLLLYENLSQPGELADNSFAPALQFVTGLNPNHMAIDDLDGDEWPDIVVVDNYTPGLSIFRNQIGSQPPDSPPSIITQPHDLSVRVGTTVTFTVQVTGTGPLAFQWHHNGESLRRATQPTLTFEATLEDAGDYFVVVTNAEGTVTSDPARLTVTEPPPDSPSTLSVRSLAPRIGLPAQTLVIRVAISDLDNNGTKDLVYINYGSDTVSVYENHALPGSLSVEAFTPRPDLPTPPNPYALAVGDIDGDQWPDLLIGSRVGDTSPGASSVLSLFRNRGETAPGLFEEKLELTVGQTVTGVAIGDLDGDGRMDLVAANLDSGTVSLFRGAGEPGELSFAARSDMTDTIFPFEIAIGDLDGDGHQDLAVANFDAGSVSVYRNTGQMVPLSPQTFEPRIDLTAGARTTSIEMSDLDADGRLDLLAANAFANNLSLYRNLSQPGSLSFTTQVILNGGAIPHTVQAADLNRDGRPELLAAAAGSQQLLVYENKSQPGELGENSFGQTLQFVTGQNPNHVAIDDLDGDEWPDVVVVDNYSPGLSIFRNLIASQPPPAPPSILTQPSDVTVMAGVSATLMVQAEGAGPFAYQWHFNGDPLPGATQSTLTLIPDLEDAGDYFVVVSNSEGAATSESAHLTVTEPEPQPPSILAHPISRTAVLGGSVTLTVVASGSAPLTYQWFHNDEALPEETAANLHLSALNASQQGFYRVVVTNPIGSVPSLEAFLTVLEFQPGTVNFANVTAPVVLASTQERLPAGDLFSAQLSAGPTPEEIQPIGDSAHFVAPGIFLGGARTIPTVRAGQVAWAQVLVWETARGATYEEATSAGGISGTSDLFEILTGGAGIPPTPPATLTGLTSFAIGGLGGVLPAQAALRPARLSGFDLTDEGFGFNLSGNAGARHRVEVSTDLHHWTLLIELPNSLETLFVLDPDASNFPIRFYRVISSQ